MARTYKRDSRGRFAGGGGSSSGGKRSGSSKASSGGGRKRNKSFVTTTGSFLTRGRAKVAQAKRTKAFSSKATAGRSAKEAYKAASGAKRKGAKARKISPQTDFATLKRRYDRTRPQSSGLTNNVDDRRGGMGPAYTRRLLNSMGTRARATKTYSAMAARPLSELKVATVRAPYGRFSTVKNPAPARSFPSQAVGRTKKGELVARAARSAAKASKSRKRR